MTEQELVERLRADAIAWHDVDLGVRLAEAADAIERLVREVSRCHERLEIDHYWRLGDNDDSDLERVEIPMDERAAFPDAVAARDATIALAESRASSAEAQLAEMREALELCVAVLDADEKVATMGWWDNLKKARAAARKALEQSQ